MRSEAASLAARNVRRQRVRTCVRLIYFILAWTMSDAWIAAFARAATAAAVPFRAVNTAAQSRTRKFQFGAYSANLLSEIHFRPRPAIISQRGARASRGKSPCPKDTTGKNLRPEGPRLNRKATPAVGVRRRACTMPVVPGLWQ